MPRSPDLHDALRCTASAGFALLQAEVDRGADVPFAFEEHEARGRPTFYEYRPLVRRFVEARAERLAGCPTRGSRSRSCARARGRDLRRAHAGGARAGRGRSSATVLLPLVAAHRRRAAAASTGTTTLFDRAYAELERPLFGTERSYAASCRRSASSSARTVELGGGIHVRPFVDRRARGLWPEASGLLPARFGREPDRRCVLELSARSRPAAREPPDARGEIADAVTALRLADGGAGRGRPRPLRAARLAPLGIRPVLPIAATQPPGEPTRLDVFRGELARRAARAARGRRRGRASSARRSTAGSCRSSRTEPFRSEQLRTSLEALLGGGDGLWAAALRAAVLLGRERPRARPSCSRGSGRSSRGSDGRRSRRCRPRRALVEVLLHGDRVELVERARRVAARRCGRVRRPLLAPRASRSPLGSADTTRHRHGTPSGLPSEYGRKRAASSTRLERIERAASVTAPGRGRCSTRCARCSPRRRQWRAPPRGRATEDAARGARPLPRGARRTAPESARDSGTAQRTLVP